jgi:hypothetical protein
MEAADLYEILAHISQTTRQHISEHRNPDAPHRTNPKYVYCDSLGYSTALFQV